MAGCALLTVIAACRMASGRGSVPTEARRGAQKLFCATEVRHGISAMFAARSVPTGRSLRSITSITSRGVSDSSQPPYGNHDRFRGLGFGSYPKGAFYDDLADGLARRRCYCFHVVVFRSE